MKPKRIIALFFTLLLFFLAIDARVCYIALNPGDVIKTQSAHGSYMLTVSRSRGTVFDRNLKPLVNRTYRYVAAVSPSSGAQEQLAALKGHVADMNLLAVNLKNGKPFTVTVDTDKISAPGVTVVETPVRYDSQSLAPHIVGYINADGSGVTGIEKSFDDELKKCGNTVTETFTVDAKGRALAGLKSSLLYSGTESGGVVLTIDSGIQTAAQAAAQKYLKAGAVVVMDIKNGDILASVSVPEYSQLDVAAALKETDSPLINRAFTAYNLGSAFKIAVSAAALESGISPAFTYTCEGAINVSGRDFRCERLSGHGKEDMPLAFANSCNTYFITVGQKTGAQNLLRMASMLGFGTQSVFAPGLTSASGALPSKTTLKQPAALANFSIGEGDIMATPVQVACMVSAVASGGCLPTARLVKGIYENGKYTMEYPGAVPEEVFSAQTASLIRSFMIKTVEEGTGKPAKPLYGGAGGKTSTAETGWVKNGKTMNQAWFAGFYPAAQPRYAIVVLCENGTAGGTNAGPVFKQIADYLAPSCGYPAVKQ